MNETLTHSLREWRDNRKLTNANTSVFVENVIEELLEIYHVDKDTINFLKTRIMMDYFDNKLIISPEHTIDCIQDIQVFSINETEQMGYDNLKCNEEVFKEINSRKQCPTQAVEWEINGVNGKWQKDKNQDKSTLYKANYKGCKR